MLQGSTKKPYRRLPNGENWNKDAWKKARERVIAMSDPVCAICQGYVDKDAPPYTPTSPEVDHIIPIIRGGSPYEIENLQLTCFKCNRKKGARMASDYEANEAENACPLSNNW